MAVTTAVTTTHDLVVQVRFRPGDFVSTGDALALVAPAASDAGARVGDDTRGSVRRRS